MALEFMEGEEGSVIAPDPGSVLLSKASNRLE
jgi:hypothetical protein